VGNILRPAGGLKWNPDADIAGAPPGTLLRADNTVGDRSGSRALRAGSEPVYTGFQDLLVNDLYSTTLQGVSWLMAGVSNRVYANGVPVGSPFEPPTTDIAFGDDAYQVFAARGKTRKKWDGIQLHNWSIAAPSLAPLVSAENLTSVTVASFDSAEAPALVANEGTRTFVANFAGTANAAVQLAADAGTGRASISKKFVSDQDYLNVGGLTGGGTDLFDIRVWFEDWRKVDKVTVMFGLGVGTDPFLDDYYYFDFNIRNPDTVNIKDPASNAASAYGIAASKSLKSLTPQEITNVRNPTEAGEILRRLGRFAGPRSTERRDAQEASPAWGHLTVTRGQFNRIGATAGKNWTTVRGFKVVYTVVPGSGKVANFDDAVWTGGGSLALTGEFTVGYRFARRFKLANETLVYYELSPMSPISNKITLNQQALEVTIPSTALAGKDPQVDEVWGYIQGGWLDTYYRFVILPATVQTGMTIDDIWMPIGGDFNSPEKRTRLTSWGFTLAPGSGSASTDVVFTSGLSEIEILIDNETYTPGTMPVPENVVGIAGPWNGRMFVLDSQGYLWPSGSSPSSFSAYHAIDLRKYGNPFWVVKTSGGITVGLSGDIVRIAGTGDESDDKLVVDLYGEPLNVGNPPFGNAILVDGNTIIYRSVDGFMALTGGTLRPLPFAGTSLLWRNQTRHGLQPIRIFGGGRFRLETDNGIVYAIVTEGASSVLPTSIWAYYPSTEEWCRFTYPFVPLSIHRDNLGRLLVGTNQGSIIEIETGIQDSSAGIPIQIVTPLDDGGNPLIRKDAVDFQLHVDTGNTTGYIQFARDGEGFGPGPGIPFYTQFMKVWRANVRNIGTFTKLQYRITGTFNVFACVAYNTSFRARPQERMALDTGYIVPPEKGDMAWINEVEVDCITPDQLNLLIYRDDILWTTLPILTLPNVRTQYRTQVPRGTKAYRLRLVLETVHESGCMDPGFEAYDIRVRHRRTGNFTSLFNGGGDGDAT
jgi:hypothetical protein